MKGCVIMGNENIKQQEDNKNHTVGKTLLFGIALISYAIGGRIGYKQGMKEGIAAGKIKGYAKCMYDVVNRFQR